MRFTALRKRSPIRMKNMFKEDEKMSILIKGMKMPKDCEAERK